MKNPYFILILLSILLVSGCAQKKSTYSPVPYLSGDVKTMTANQLCLIRAGYTKDLFYAETLDNATSEQLNYIKQRYINANIELKKRIFSKTEWERIENHEYWIGMSSDALICSLGMPSRINDSSHGPTQYVYFDGGRYIYTRNGRVTSWN